MSFYFYLKRNTRTFITQPTRNIGHGMHSKHVQTSRLFKVLQVISLIHLLACHNILRTPKTRRAKFVLRHTDRVQGAVHYRELVVAAEAICIDRCVADDPCKSVNAHAVDSSTVICQLVDKDITDNRDYPERPGWRHFDTGRSRVTRIRTLDGQFCIAPDKNCGVAWVWSWIYVYSVTDPTGTSKHGYRLL